MKKLTWLVTLLALSLTTALAQSKTTQELDEDVDGLSLYFYKNTLRMLNQKDNKEYDEMIKDIEKMKFLLIDRQEEDFDSQKYKKLKSSYGGESYEEVMSSRFNGKNFDVLVREAGGNVKGTVVLASDSTQIFVLDILGKVALDKVIPLFQSLDESSDIGKRIKDFMDIDID